MLVNDRELAAILGRCEVREDVGLKVRLRVVLFRKERVDLYEQNIAVNPDC